MLGPGLSSCRRGHRAGLWRLGGTLNWLGEGMGDTPALSPRCLPQGTSFLLVLWEGRGTDETEATASGSRGPRGAQEGHLLTQGPFVKHPGCARPVLSSALEDTLASISTQVEGTVMYPVSRDSKMSALDG